MNVRRERETIGNSRDGICNLGARAKRQWEASLPPLDDPQQWEKRFKMMSDMERHEWLLRENEIEKLQNLRIELLEKMLKENEGQQYEASIERINRQWTKKQAKREDFVKMNRLHYLRGIHFLFFPSNTVLIFFSFSYSSSSTKTWTSGNKVREK